MLLLLELKHLQEQPPSQRLVDWIRDPSTKEIFMAYLSFSEYQIQQELCAAGNRGVKITLVNDISNEINKFDAMIKTLSQCIRDKNNFTARYIGNTPDKKIGFAHNKVTIINPSSSSVIKIAFGSANMTPGLVTLHENWNFVTTSVNSHFAQTHLCLKDALLSHVTSLDSFSSFISNCRDKITSPEEEDIKVFLVPGKWKGEWEGLRALKVIDEAFARSLSVFATAHRYSQNNIINGLNKLAQKGLDSRLVVDDDLYWAGVFGHGFGRNMFNEFKNLSSSISAGVNVRYVETMIVPQADVNGNIDLSIPAPGQLQHNKYLIFNFKNSGAVFTGAGNFTQSAFHMPKHATNLENYYYITIPEVVKSYNNQYDYFWTNLSTSFEEMPKGKEGFRP